MHRRLIAALAVLAATALVAAPSASAKTKGTTSLEVAPATLDALGSLGVAPAAIGPAKLDGATFSFPITNSLRSALRSGVVRHRGGISLTAGGTTVALTGFHVDLFGRKLIGKVNGAGPVALLDLDYARIGFAFDRGRLALGPIGTTLTQGAADALNEAFGVTAFSDATVLGDVTVRTRL